MTNVNASSPVEYGITLLVLDEGPFIPISSDEFQCVKTANGVIDDAVRVEQAFALCIANYFELEQELLRCSLNQMIYVDHEWQSFTEMELTLSRRVLNLLSAANSYEEQTKELGDAAKNTTLRQFKLQLETNTLEYRVGRRLRNVVLHEGFEISLPTLGLSWDHSLVVPQCGFKTDLALDVAKLARMKGRGKHQRGEMLKDLRSLGEEIDFLQLLRRYVEALGSLHDKTRDLTAGDRGVARETYGRVLAHCDAFRRKSGLHVVARDATGETLESYYISADLLRYLRHLKGRHSIFQNLSRRYVTSTADVKKKPPAPPGSDAWEE